MKFNISENMTSGLLLVFEIKTAYENVILTRQLYIKANIKNCLEKYLSGTIYTFL